jgi:predicted nucleic acid-binding protein
LTNALNLGEQYADSGVDLTDLTVMAMAHTRDAAILTWDFRHFRSGILEHGHHWPLLVEEHELPSP